MPAVSLWWKVIATLLLVIETGICFVQVYPSPMSLKVPELNAIPLPRTVIPTGYSLSIIPRLNENYFNGTVKINITCLESTNNVLLHAYEDLDILNIAVKHINRTESGVPTAEDFLQVANISRNTEKETVLITLNDELVDEQRYELFLKFNGSFGGEYTGLYKGLSEDPYVGTFMMTTNARRVFPCFDEPSMKAPFQISVARPSNMSSLSMMPIEFSEQAEEEGWMWDHFFSTPPISTFSVNILVSNLQSGEPMIVSSTFGNMTIQLHHRDPHILQRLRNVIASAPQMMQFLQEYLGVAYPVQKLDIVALSDHPFENRANSLGILMMRESRLEREGELALVHDLTYQFINHMVTPEFPSVNVSNFLGSYLAKVGFLKVTNKESFYFALSSQLYWYFTGIAAYTITPGQKKSFDFKQGEGVFQLLNATLTESVFRKGLTDFLSTNKYNMYNEDILWDALSKEAHLDRKLPESVTVKDIVNSWRRNGFHLPEVTVTRNYNNNTASLAQNSFADEWLHNHTEEEQGLLWWIPIMYYTAENFESSSEFQVNWMKGERHLSINNLPDSSSYIIVNPFETGMIVINYDQQNWDLIINKLKSSGPEFPVATRIKLLNDAWALAANGKLSYNTVLNMTSVFLTNETDIAVWFSFIKQHESINYFYRWTQVEEKLNVFLRNLLVSKYESMGYSDINDDLSMELFYSVKSTLCELGYQSCIDAQNKSISRDFATFSLHDNVTGIINGLMNEDLNNISVNWDSLVSALTSNPTSHNRTFNILLGQFESAKQKFGSQMGTWDLLMRSVIKNIKSQIELDQITNLYAQNKEKLDPSTQKIVEDSMLAVRLALQWGNRSIPDIENWLDGKLSS